MASDITLSADTTFNYYRRKGDDKFTFCHPLLL